MTREVRRRERAGEGVGNLLGRALDRLGSEGERDGSSSAWIAWNRVNGDVERAHSTGAYVGAPRRGARDPELVIYVDSHAFITDFSANREVYLARLETAGLRFSRIEFRLSKRPRTERPPAASPRREERPLPELTAEEEREVSKLCDHLPAALRDSVSQAMRVSYRAQKQEHS